MGASRVLDLGFRCLSLGGVIFNGVPALNPLINFGQPELPKAAYLVGREVPAINPSVHAVFGNAQNVSQRVQQKPKVQSCSKPHSVRSSRSVGWFPKNPVAH